MMTSPEVQEMTITDIQATVSWIHGVMSSFLTQNKLSLLKVSSHYLYYF